MDLTGLYVLVAGILVAILVTGGSFLFAIFNMSSGMTSNRAPEDMFKGHLKSMGGMAVGGGLGAIIMVIGVVMLIVEAFSVYG